MRTRQLAAAAALALMGAALVATPAQAAASTDPSCTYRVQHRTGPKDVLTWQVTNQGTWSFGAVVFVHLTDLNVSQRYSTKIDPSTHKASVNLTRKTGGHPYTIESVSLNGKHVPDDFERIGVGCTPA